MIKIENINNFKDYLSYMFIDDMEKYRRNPLYHSEINIVVSGIISILENYDDENVAYEKLKKIRIENKKKIIFLKQFFKIN